MFSKFIKRAQLSAKEGNAYKKSGSPQFNCLFKQTSSYSCFLPIRFERLSYVSIESNLYACFERRRVGSSFQSQLSSFISFLCF